MNLLNLSLAPVLIILFYIYIRDKYEKEPYQLLIFGLIYGALMSFPIILTENIITKLEPDFVKKSFLHSFFKSFFVASLVEEFFKYIFIYFYIWKNKNFNEMLDGIVYSVFLSLGFAGIENILYVFNPELGGVNTAIARAIISVPVHAIFGVFMGYYFSEAKFYSVKLARLKAFLIPFFIHGIYDSLLISKIIYNRFIFILFLIYIWYSSLMKIKHYVNNSPFKNT